MMKVEKPLKPAAMAGEGKSPLLRLRMNMTKYAATRGWVVPFLTVRPGVSQKWKKARKGDNIGYHHYPELDETSERLLGEIMSRAQVSDVILDMGCNVGRELNHLWTRGYRRLAGVEIGEEPVRAMRDAFPEMASASRIINQSMTEAVRGFKDGEFHLIYSHSSLVSLNAREQFVFDHMCRATSRYIVTMENESSMRLFPRDFGRVFTSRGMKQIHHAEIPNKQKKKDVTLRVFEKQ